MKILMVFTLSKDMSKVFLTDSSCITPTSRISIYKIILSMNTRLSLFTQKPGAYPFMQANAGELNAALCSEFFEHM